MELKEIEKIKETKGETLGISLKEDLECIMEKEGEEGLKKLEKELENYGYSLKYKEIKKYSFYPLALEFLILAVSKEIFNWKDEDIRELGKRDAKFSFVLKLMLKYFISVKKAISVANEYWRKYYTVGKLIPGKVDEKERFAELMLIDFPGHPNFCRLLEGFFWQIGSFIVEKENLKVKEIECPFKGGNCHRFQITW